VLTHAYDLVLQPPFPASVGDRDAEVVELRKELAPRVIAAVKQADASLAPTRAGIASGLIHGIEPAGDILRRMVSEAEQLLRGRPAQVLR